MGITRISFENVKSIKNSFLNLTDLNILIGKNGAGKSNIEKYINYFYRNLLSNNISKDVFDIKNPYNDRIKISICYNFEDFMSDEKNLNKDIFNEIIEVLNGKKEICLEFIQYKDNRIEWNYDYNIRKKIKYLFPIYFIDTRNLDILDWNVVWDIIGDLGQFRSDIEGDLTESLDKLLVEIYGDKHKENLKMLRGEFENNGYSFKSYKNSDVFKQLYKLRFKGEQFVYKNNSLNYYSDGSNSFNYFKLFYQVLKKLHINKLKSPLIILDEPEIGLHPNFIDELIELITNDIGRIQTVLSTHSPRIVRNSLIKDNTNIFEITYKEEQSLIKKVKNVNENKSKKVISDKEASYYFSKGIMFVEGISEYELFTHPILKQRFPILNEVEIFSYNSNNISLDVSHPTQRKLNIPYLLILDMDKIITYNNESQKFNITGDIYNPLKNTDISKKERYSYGESRIFHITRNRLIGISSKVQFSYSPFTFRFNDRLFQEFIDILKEYCKHYNVYPISTTVEGLMVNDINYKIFYRWLTRENSKYMGKRQLVEIWNMSDDAHFRINVLLHIVEGKLETLFSLKKKKLVSGLPDNILKEGYNKTLSLPRLEKASGWISNYLEYVYILLEKNNKVSIFNDVFPELTDIIKTMEIIKDE